MNRTPPNNCSPFRAVHSDSERRAVVRRRPVHSARKRAPVRSIPNGHAFSDSTNPCLQALHRFDGAPAPALQSRCQDWNPSQQRQFQECDPLQAADRSFPCPARQDCIRSAQDRPQQARQACNRASSHRFAMRGPACNMAFSDRLACAVPYPDIPFGWPNPLDSHITESIPQIKVMNARPRHWRDIRRKRCGHWHGFQLSTGYAYYKLTWMRGRETELFKYMNVSGQDQIHIGRQEVRIQRSEYRLKTGILRKRMRQVVRIWIIPHKTQQRMMQHHDIAPCALRQRLQLCIERAVLTQADIAGLDLFIWRI